MAQKKLLRFAQIKEFKNVLEQPENVSGKWNEFFNNANPIVLELACGRGEYSVGLAAMHPDKNFIGVDIKGNRIYIGAKKALDAGLNNAAFLRTQIDKIDYFFAAGEVDEIWITFPDPQLRTSKAKKRLTHPKFLRRYQQILKPGGQLHLKTDSPDLFNFTKRVIELYKLTLISECNDVNKLSDIPELKIRTHYEALDIAGSSSIYHLQFSLPNPLPMFDEELQEELKRTEKFLIA